MKGENEMKKTISILLCIMMQLGLAACGTKNDPNGSGSAAEDVPEIIANNVTDSEDMMEVDSPVGTLYYPEKWKDDIVFQVNGDQFVGLYYDIPLFTLYFGGETGDLYGTLKYDGADIELRYEMHELDSTHQDYETMIAMQEDINIIFQYLIQEGRLTVAG